MYNTVWSLARMLLLIRVPLTCICWQTFFRLIPRWMLWMIYGLTSQIYRQWTLESENLSFCSSLSPSYNPPETKPPPLRFETVRIYDANYIVPFGRSTLFPSFTPFIINLFRYKHVRKYKPHNETYISLNFQSCCCFGEQQETWTFFYCTFKEKPNAEERATES